MAIQLYFFYLLFCNTLPFQEIVSYTGTFAFSLQYNVLILRDISNYDLLTLKERRSIVQRAKCDSTAIKKKKSQQRIGS